MARAAGPARLDLRLPGLRRLARQCAAARLQGRLARLGLRLRSGDRRSQGGVARPAALPAGPQPGRAAAGLPAASRAGRRPRQHRRGQRLLARERAEAQAQHPLLLVRARAAGHAAVRLLSGPPAEEGRRPAARRDPAMAALVPEPALQRRRGRRGGTAQLRPRALPGARAVDDRRRTHDARRHRKPRELLCRRTERGGAHCAGRRAGPAHRHFGFFREQFSQSLWPSTLDKLHRLASLTALQHANVPHTTA